MARKKKISHKRGFTISALVVAGMVPGANVIYQASKEQNGLQRMGVAVTKIYTGYDSDTNKWSISELRKGLVPLAMGAIGHKIANRLGVNRMIAQAGIPFIRL